MFTILFGEANMSPKEEWKIFIKWLAKRSRFWRKLANETSHPFPHIAVFQRERQRESLVILRKAVIAGKEIS